ncbi:hypothetical protein [Bosea vaviloviae]|uniref:hypothetical protein n=1 Tax=Bosea vaviloviae TaxID=1526658 RepID=UPI0011DF0D59|nr:hypothetical protein [Bosea vaviloviae]
MSNSQRKLLDRIVVGDIFHAKTSNDASLICLVTGLNEKYIESRTVTNQKYVQIDRTTGLGKMGTGSVDCFVDSLAPLPVAIYNEMLGLDRKFRLAQNEDDLKLTDSEKNALLFIYSFYAERPL